ncbi:hypothetical protein VP01_1232g3 [Puccinia sorghi]|uniref:Uncharacterized protein n=1 Tax=Puccinia sorghi TaxID=27349 RepID=A0A0L6VPS2_9BASI|nr:hypothetical protein VP01_1232g3 [Puccinia sorghi]
MDSITHVLRINGQACRESEGGSCSSIDRSNHTLVSSGPFWGEATGPGGLREKIEGIPRDVVRVANPEGPAQAKSEATLASGVEWSPPVVGAEVWVVQSDERVMFGELDQMDVNFPKKSKGKETAGPSMPVPGKKQVAEWAKLLNCQ